MLQKHRFLKLTLDLPIGGKGYSSQSPLLIFEYVNTVNAVSEGENIENDTSGCQTVQFLKKARKISNLINSVHPSSLGLHPAVYFYSKTGRHKTASFFAVTEFLIELENKKKLKFFTENREVFEDLMIEYDFINQQILRHYRSSSKAVPHMKKYMLLLLDEISNNDRDVAIKNILNHEDFKFLKSSESISEESEINDFSEAVKSATFITEALSSAIKCKICNSRVHVNSITIDHKERKQDGGHGDYTNAQLAHPYCNSTFKN